MNVSHTGLHTGRSTIRSVFVFELTMTISMTYFALSTANFLPKDATKDVC